MSAGNLPLIDLIRRGGPAVLVMQCPEFILVISAYGENDLVVEILPQSARGQSHWPRNAPVCRDLVARVEKIRNFPIAWFLLPKRRVTYHEYAMESGR